MVNADSLGTDTKIVSRRLIMFRKVWKRCRWFAVQAALLAFNIAQTEWVCTYICMYIYVHIYMQCDFRIFTGRGR
jgi:hypothetical protein